MYHVRCKTFGEAVAACFIGNSITVATLLSRDARWKRHQNRIGCNQTPMEPSQEKYQQCITTEALGLRFYSARSQSNAVAPTKEEIINCSPERQIDRKKRQPEALR